MRTAAQSPTGTCVGPNLCQPSRFRPMISTSASTGWPELGAILPPNRRPIRAPRPASKQMRTAIGSQIGPRQALSTFFSIVFLG
jgi:hypothetical protein